MKVSDYIASFLIHHNIDTLFTITGGFAMHLNDSFGRHNKFDIYYHHHEQAAAYAACGYSKIANKTSVVCTTAGVAATNAISPCLVAYQDSLRVFFISGQVKSSETIRYLSTSQGMNLRHYSGADCDIISMVSPITKYAIEVEKKEDIPQIMKDAYHALTTGRPGPVWISIPADIQGSLLNGVEDFGSVNKVEDGVKEDQDHILQKSEDMKKVLELLKQSKRPVIIGGNGVIMAGGREIFREFVKTTNIPAVFTIMATDLLESEDDHAMGKIGLIGDRHGNFVMQNADLLLTLGCRMAQGIVGYRSDWFAREARIIYVDNDKEELKKDNIQYDQKVYMDVVDFMNVVLEMWDSNPDDTDDHSNPHNQKNEWLVKCQGWKQKWIWEMPPLIEDDPLVNPYHFLRAFFSMAPGNKITLASSGSIVTNMWHMLEIKNGDRSVFSSQGDMGYELPASIGCAIGSGQTVYPILGEGSFQLNIQELQTMVQYKLPIKILLFNNGKYGAIEMTQSSFFGAKFGVDTSSGISFPDTEKIAYAYGIRYLSVRKREEIHDTLEEFLSIDAKKGPVIFEIFCCVQGRYPRLKAYKQEDGTFLNRPLEDLDPFMSREELEREMVVKMV
jgi:acetolactate synthase-1/2/3 large subunit